MGNVRVEQVEKSGYPRADQTVEGGSTMKDEPIEVVRGSGNVFADFGYPNADAEQLKATLSAEIISVMNDRALTVRRAEELTGVAAADFSRIRKAKLDRFTIDRLMTILNRLDQDVDVQITIRSRVVELTNNHPPL